MQRRVSTPVSLWTLGVCGVILCGLSTAGCGPKMPNEGPVVTIRGRVTNAGKPLTVQGRDIGLGFVAVLFCRCQGEGASAATGGGIYSCQADADGNFKVVGRFGNGIPPGKYRIAVRQWDPFPQHDALDGKFDENCSPILREINRSDFLEIDLSKP